MKVRTQIYLSAAISIASFSGLAAVIGLYSARGDRESEQRVAMSGAAVPGTADLSAFRGKSRFHAPGGALVASAADRDDSREMEEPGTPRLAVQMTFLSETTGDAALFQPSDLPALASSSTALASSGDGGRSIGAEPQPVVNAGSVDAGSYGLAGWGSASLAVLDYAAPLVLAPTGLPVSPPPSVTSERPDLAGPASPPTGSPFAPPAGTGLPGQALLPSSDAIPQLSADLAPRQEPPSWAGLPSGSSPSSLPPASLSTGGAPVLQSNPGPAASLPPAAPSTAAPPSLPGNGTLPQSEILKSHQPAETPPPASPPLVIAGTDPVWGDLHIGPVQLHNPGHSPGLQAISGDYILDGILRIELAGTIPGLEYDQLLIDGEAILNGRIEVVLLDGFVPGEDDVFDIIVANGFTLGELFSIDFPDLPAGRSFRFSFFGLGDGHSAFRITDPVTAPSPILLQQVVVAEPTTVSSLGLGLLALCLLGRRRRYLPERGLVANAAVRALSS